MDTDFIKRLTAQSTIGELPSYDVTVDMAAKGEFLRDVLSGDPELPGVIVTDGSRVRGSISRGQYQQLVSGQFGREIYLPRPLHVMFGAIEGIEDPLMLPDTTPIRQAVGESLRRPRQIIYEPVLVRAASSGDTSLRLIDYPDLLRADSRISDLRNRQMAEILATVQEGFVLVDRDGRIASEYSRSIEAIFETTAIAGRTLPEVVAEVLDAEKAELCADYLATLFNPNVIEKLVIDINPLRRAVALGGSKHLAFGFRRSLDEDRIRHVLVRVEDVSREAELAAELEEQERKAREQVDLALDIVKADADELTAFLGRLDRELASSHQLIASSGDPSSADERLQVLFRGIHALKGDAALLGLEIYQARIHQLEDAIEALRRRPGVTLDDLGSLEDLAEAASETRGLIAQFRKLGGAVETRPATTAVSRKEPPELLESLSSFVADLSRRLGKPARFLSRVAEAQVPSRYRGLLRDALVQLVRNSLVHGLEPPEERRRRGKPELGTLQFALREHPGHGKLEFIFQDDGSGLDFEKIRLEARTLGLAAGDEEALKRLIFESGFSTAEQSTPDAGRGVGMDMVRARVEEHGGYIVPHSRSGEFCAFQIVLPMEAPS